MNKALLAIAVVCILISILSPIVSCIYFADRLDDVSESYDSQIADLEQENEGLRQEIQQLKEENEEIKPPYKDSFLVTELGWYLHGSTDPNPDSRNKLTVYGDVHNVGATPATKCKLIVTFYKNMTLLQSSEINIGTINNWSSKRVYRKNIDCEMADNVTRIEVERTWENMVKILS